MSDFVPGNVVAQVRDGLSLYFKQDDYITLLPDCQEKDDIFMTFFLFLFDLASSIL